MRCPPRPPHRRLGPLVLLLPALVCGGGTSATHAQVPPRPPAGAAAARGAAGEEVLAASRAYKAALDRGDSAAVKSMWMADGDIVDDMGNVMRGHETADGLAPAAEGEIRPDFRIDDVTVRLITETVAIEDGTVTVTPPGSTVAHHGRFSATWVRAGDGWKLASLREWRTDPPESASGLEALAWLEGDWDVQVHGDRDDAKPVPKVEMRVRWNPSRTYLIRETRLSLPDGGDAKEVTQRIGWDPLTRQIRSWSFDGDGGRSEAVWTLEEGVWVSRTMSVLPDGSLTRSINHYLFDGADACTYQSLPVTPDDEHAHPTTMTMTRKTGRPTE